MKHLYEQSWFINFINWLRNNSTWFEKYGYGKSINIEDFVRNPFEVLRDECPPFCFKDVNAYSLLLRIGFIPYKKELEEEYLNEIKNDFNDKINLNLCKGTYKKLYDGKSLGFNYKKYRIIDIIFSKWITKYTNALLMCQIMISLKYKVIPIPFISMNIRFSKTKYFQFGVGWAPQWENYNGSNPGSTKSNAVMCGKLRIGDYSGELQWNPGSEVYGYWEGNN